MSPVVPDEDVRALLDIIAVEASFDSSGFLETEQVVILRRVAKLVGVDPEAVTPPSMPHTFVPRNGLEHMGCGKPGCHCEADHPCHSGWPFTDDWKPSEE